MIRYRVSNPDGLAEIPSDVDGLYGILDRTREPEDPAISNEYLDRDVGYAPSGRADTAIRLLGSSRFTGFRQGRFDLLAQSFCLDESSELYDLVVIGSPVWVATPPPGPTTSSAGQPG